MTLSSGTPIRQLAKDLPNKDYTTYIQLGNTSTTCDHRLWRIGHPVRSAIHKPQIGGLVVGSVTTSEYPLLHVFDFVGIGIGVVSGIGLFL